jgi:multidrug efflux pump
MSPNLTMVVHLTSPGRTLRRRLPAQLRARCSIKDELARLPGVGQAMVFGAGDYAMRVWIDPDRPPRAG